MPRAGSAWARIGHDQAIRANLTALHRARHIYSADARTRRYERLRCPAIAGRRPSPLRPEAKSQSELPALWGAWPGNRPSMSAGCMPLTVAVVTHLVTRLLVSAIVSDCGSPTDSAVTI
jgi:hypothetical protein